MGRKEENNTGVVVGVEYAVSANAPFTKKVILRRPFLHEAFTLVTRRDVEEVTAALMEVLEKWEEDAG